MTTTARGEGKRETWRDWQAPDAPPAQLLTRDETLTQLNRLGLQVDMSDLRFWEYRGVLPAPVRQRHAGAVRAIYPHWYAPLVYMLRIMQHAGWKLDDLKPLIRKQAQRVSRTADADSALLRGMLGWAPRFEALTSSSLPEEVEAGVIQGLNWLTEHHSQANVSHATVTLENGRGQPVATYRFALIGWPVEPDTTEAPASASAGDDSLSDASSE